MKILLVEDSRDIRLLVDSALAGLQVDHAEDLENGFRKFQSTRYDLVLLDLVLPDGNGFSLFEKMKTVQKYKTATPVIFLTLKNESSVKVRAFGLGAADFIVKPFDPDELRARIMARAGGVAQFAAQSTDVAIGNIILKINEHMIFYTSQGKNIECKLTPKEFRLFYLLFKNTGEILHRDIIMKKIWNEKAEVNMRIVDKYMNNLRKKLSADLFKIEAVHSSGYRMIIQDKNE